jgi:hypothetical protein
MKRIPLSQGYVALVDDEDFGLIMSHNKWFANKHHGNVYAKCNITRPDGRRTTLKMHRLIMDARQGEVVDHINGNGLDNRKCNLRITNERENAANRKPHKGTSSRYKGVSYHKQHNKWQSNICVNYKCLYLGIFEKEVDAAIAYDIAAVKHFGEFARLNFPQVKEAVST